MEYWNRQCSIILSQAAERLHKTTNKSRIPSLCATISSRQEPRWHRKNEDNKLCIRNIEVVQVHKSSNQTFQQWKNALSIWQGRHFGFAQGRLHAYIWRTTWETMHVVNRHLRDGIGDVCMHCRLRYHSSHSVRCVLIYSLSKRWIRMGSTRFVLNKLCNISWKLEVRCEGLFEYII